MNDYIENALTKIDKKNDFIQRINALTLLENKSPVKIISDASITLLSQTIKPRKKDYDIYLEEGIKMGGVTMSNMQQGRKAWKDGTHGMTTHLEHLVYTYGDEEINRNLLKTALQLIKISIEHIFMTGSEKKKDKLNKFIQNTNFLFVMLQMAVKLIGIKLYNLGVDIENKTLEYMTKMIEEDQRNIKKLFSEAVNSGEEELNNVISIYYDSLSKYFTDFLSRNFTGTLEVLSKIGEENKLVEQLKEENIMFFIGVLLANLKDRALQLVFEFEENNKITIK